MAIQVLRFRAVLAVAALVAWSAGVCAQQRASVPLADLLTRAGAALGEYEEKFSAVVMEERYWQSVIRVGTVAHLPSVTTGRTIRSDVVLINGSKGWLQFRDVFEVDGSLVRDRDGRLQALFTNPSARALNEAAAIADESARYNIGSLKRNINVPTMALVYLRRDNQARSQFRIAGNERVNGTDTVLVDFSEKRSPTVIRSDTGDLPASGRFWIEPASGVVLKTEFHLHDATMTGVVTVSYADNAKIDMRVPVKMTESYGLNSGERISGEATYSNFRKYAVTSRIIKH